MKLSKVDLKNFLLKIRAQLSAPQEPAMEDVYLIPAHLFFSHKVSLPEAISEAEIHSLAELTLEELSPFPIEQLAWGHVYDDKHLLIYAASKDRTKADDMARLQAAYHVFPSFLSFWNKQVDKTGIYFLRSKNSLSAVLVEAGSPIPTPLKTVELAEDELEGEALFKAKDALIQGLDGGSTPIDAGVYHAFPPEILSDGSVALNLDYQASADALPEPEYPTVFKPNESTWHADVRNMALKASFKKARQRNKLLWKSIQFAGAVALIIILLDLTTLTSHWVAKARQRKIDHQRPEVSQVENNQQLLDKVEQFYNQETMPFDMLDILNQKRPKAIYFTNVTVSSYNTIEVKGIGDNVEAVNSYTDALRNDPKAQSAELVDIVTRKGKVNFTLKATLNMEKEGSPL